MAEYLLGEVLQRNTAQVQGLLLATSVTQPLCADLAEAMAPGISAQQVLEGLAARNEFVTGMGPGNNWFRYHPMLRDMLEHALRRDDPSGFLTAHQRAALWWAAHGDPIKAIGHAAQARDRALFGEIYTSAAAAELVGAGRDALHTCLTDAVRALPDGVVTELQHAGLAFAEGRAGALRSHIEVAQKLLDSGEPADHATRVLHQLFSVAGHRFSGDADATMAAAARAIVLLDSADPFPAAASYRLIAEHSLAVGQMWSGLLAEAEDHFNYVLADERQAVGADLATLGARANLALTATLRVGWMRERLGHAQPLTAPRHVGGPPSCRHAPPTRPWP